MLRIISLVTAGVIAALAVSMAVRVIEHAEQPVYLIPDVGVAVILAALTVVVAVAVAMMKLDRGWVIAAALGAFLFIFVGILLTLLGIPLMLIGGVLLALAVRSAADLSLKKQALILLMGAAGAFALALIFMAWRHPPLVDCASGRVSSSYWYWGGGPSRASGSSQVSPDGRIAGEQTIGEKTYAYTCDDGHLVKFERVATPS